MKDADTILADLEQDSWVCGSHFQATYRPCYAQRISRDLKAGRGLEIESRVCREHNHRGSIHAYHLVRHPEQLRLGA